jgi:polygalacturonase
MITRRAAIREAFAAGAGFALWSCCSASPIGQRTTTNGQRTTNGDPWGAVEDILARITPPRIPRRDFDLAAYGGDIQKAIDACAWAGGGRVVVPAGEHASGPLRLARRVELHVARGATIHFSNDPERYPLVLTRWEGIELMNYAPLIYAFECEDVAITGEGTLDGGADETHWWPWKGSIDHPGAQIADRDRLRKQAEDGVPVAERVYGAGHSLRPSFIEPYRCRNVLIEGVTIVNSPFWCTHPTLCTNVIVRGIKVNSHGPNNDGCDPESCRDVLIEDCLFDAGDDCIALKSGRNADGRRLNVPVENVVIRRCEMRAGHGGITVGSETSGGARNIFAEQCKLDSPELERGLRLKTNTLRGGTIENVFVRDITIGNVKLAPIEIDLRYDPPEAGAFVPVVRNVRVERMTSAKSRHGLYIHGLPAAQVHGIVVRDSAFRGVAEGNVIEGTVDLTLTGVTIEPAPKPKEKS